MGEMNAFDPHRPHMEWRSQAQFPVLVIVDVLIYKVDVCFLRCAHPPIKGCTFTKSLNLPRWSTRAVVDDDDYDSIS